MANVATVASAAPEPSALKTAVPRRTAPISRESPRMPLQVIITAAKTVSRASELLAGPPDAVSVRMSPTSMTVTATASTSEPNGSPTRSATTSAWCTAASTAAARTTPTAAATGPGSSRPHAASSTTSASTGTAVVQRIVRPAPLMRRSVSKPLSDGRIVTSA